MIGGAAALRTALPTVAPRTGMRHKASMPPALATTSEGAPARRPDPRRNPNSRGSETVDRQQPRAVE